MECLKIILMGMVPLHLDVCLLRCLRGWCSWKNGRNSVGVDKAIARTKETDEYVGEHEKEVTR